MPKFIMVYSMKFTSNEFVDMTPQTKLNLSNLSVSTPQVGMMFEWICIKLVLQKRRVQRDITMMNLYVLLP